VEYSYTVKALDINEEVLYEIESGTSSLQTTRARLLMLLTGLRSLSKEPRYRWNRKEPNRRA